VSVRVLPHSERAHGTGTVLVVMTTEDIIHGTDTGITGVDEDVYHREYLFYMSASCPSVLYVYLRILESPAPPLSVPPLRHISYVP